MTDTLESAVMTWQNHARTDPFNTWLILENSDAVHQAQKFITTPILSSRLTTLKKLAETIFIETAPQKTLLRSEDVLIKIAGIARGSRFARNKTVSPRFINQIIGVYNFLRMHKIALGEFRETLAENPDSKSLIDKIDKFNDIFSRFEAWCRNDDGEMQYYDVFAAEEECVRLLKENQYQLNNVSIYHTAPQNALETEFLSLIREKADEVIEYPHIVPETVEVPTLDKENIHIYNVASAEIEAVLEQAAVLIENKEAEPSDILIITPDIDSTVPLLETRIHDYYYRDENGTLIALEYDAGAGLPAAGYPLVQYVLSALNAVTYDYKLTDLQTILSCPYYPFAVASSLTAGKLSQIAKITGVNKGKTQWLKVQRRFEFRTEGTKAELEADKVDKGKMLFHASSMEISGIIDRLEKLTEGKTYRTRSAALNGWLEANLLTGTLSSENEAALKVLFRYLTVISTSVISDEACTLREFVVYLTQYLQQTPVSVAKTKPCIQVAKLRYAANRHAKFVFIISVTADLLPNITTHLPPFTEKETRLLYPALIQDRRNADLANFKAALQCADKKLYISCFCRNEAKHTVPSTFFMQMLDQVGKSEEEVMTSVNPVHSVWNNQMQAGECIRNCSERGVSTPEGSTGVFVEALAGLPAWESLKMRVEREWVPFGYVCDFSTSDIVSQFKDTYGEEYTFAPTTLETYLKCPYRWYLEKHLRLYTPWAASSDAVLVGNVVHASLDEFIRTFGKEVTEENRAEALSCLREIVVQKLGNPDFASPAFTATKNRYLGEGGISSMNVPSILEQFIDHEIKLSLAGFASTPEMAEVSLDKVRICAGYGDSVSSFYISGKIDRVLENAQGQFMIIDYKTGKSFKVKKHPLVQLPLYLEAYAEKEGKCPVDGYYLQVSSREMKEVSYFTFEKSISTDEKARVLLPQVSEKISMCAEKIEMMRQGKCQLTTKCDRKYCPFSRICRVRYQTESDGGES